MFPAYLLFFFPVALFINSLCHVVKPEKMLRRNCYNFFLVTCNNLGVGTYNNIYLLVFDIILFTSLMVVIDVRIIKSSVTENLKKSFFKIFRILI